MVRASVIRANDGGILVENVVSKLPAVLVIEDSEIRGAGNVLRSGIRLDGLFTASIARTLITENEASNVDGAGIYADGFGTRKSTLVLEDVEFAGNEADTGGGLFASEVSVSADGCVYSQNRAVKSGGGIFLEQGATFDGNGTTTLVGNEAMDGGGIYISDGQLSGVLLQGVNGADRGGAIAAYLLDVDDPLVLEDVRIEGNQANEEGGGIHVGSNTEVVLEPSSTLHGNSVAGNSGGGAYLAGIGSSLTIRGATVSTKTSTNDPNDVTFGDGTSVTLETATPFVECTFADLACISL